MMHLNLPKHIHLFNILPSRSISYAFTRPNHTHLHVPTVWFTCSSHIIDTSQLYDLHVPPYDLNIYMFQLYAFTCPNCTHLPVSTVRSYMSPPYALTCPTVRICMSQPYTFTRPSHTIYMSKLYTFTYTFTCPKHTNLRCSNHTHLHMPAVCVYTSQPYTFTRHICAHTINLKITVAIKSNFDNDYLCNH